MRDGGEKGRSVARRSLSVAPSPLNGVKFELGVILLVGVILLLVVGRLVADAGTQLLLLAGYGVLGMVWLIVRTRRVLRRRLEEKRDGEE